MRRYTVILKFESDGPDDYWEAREDFNALALQIEDTHDLQNMVAGVTVQPREAGGSTLKELHDEAGATAEQLLGLEAHSPGADKPEVTHPWDQGLWIFPEDHVLHEVEVQVKASRHHRSPSWQGAKQQLLEIRQMEEQE